MEKTPLIQHLVVIMDGNGRWAQNKGLARSSGHKAGITAVKELLKGCEKHKIQNLTLFAFSSENWQRPKGEVQLLMDLFLSTLSKEINDLVAKNVRLKFIGNVSAFGSRLQNKIDKAEQATAQNCGMHLNIAVNYGGRWDITEAAKRLAEQVQQGKIQPEEINIDIFEKYVCLSDLPEPDLLIRTGGEYRISNFLNWQLAYTELFFTDCLWPDFNIEELYKAIQWYMGRQRRFGKTPEQAMCSDESKVSHA